MNWLVYHIVSGHAFFTGVILIAIAAFVSTQSKPVCRPIASLSFVIGVIAIVISSTAISNWVYAIAAGATVAWLVPGFRKKWRIGSAIAMASVWFVAALIEIPYHITPMLLPAPNRLITVVGDSITAGVEGDKTSATWPKILERQHGLEIQDISHAGDTASLALERARTRDIKSAVVVVEIGGNDLLGSTTPAEFAHDLDALLSHLVASERQILMFELPLPPFCHSYGRIQRTAAVRYGVMLIP
ncbi:MAG: SGNH/GDSL hydrolase family protein, partial [Planctomycetales bacterium]